MSLNFSRLQSAYRRGHSTETALLHVLNAVYTAVYTTVLVGLDISAAFDTIDHRVLFGTSWESVRSLRRSIQVAALIGLPHRSPSVCQTRSLLFNSYTVWIRRSTRVGARAAIVYSVMYRRSANWYSHTACRVTSSLMTLSCSLWWTLQTQHRLWTLERLTRCSAAVQQWLLQNGLLLNANKSEVTILCTASQLKSATVIPLVNIAGCSLPVASDLKSLGVVIDGHLQVDSHAREIIRACNYHTRASP